MTICTSNLQTDLNTYFASHNGSSYSWYPLTVDGICGTYTVNAIKAFQGLVGLSVDGVAGNRTKEYLYKMVAPFYKYKQYETIHCWRNEDEIIDSFCVYTIR